MGFNALGVAPSCNEVSVGAGELDRGEGEGFPNWVDRLRE